MFKTTLKTIIAATALLTGATIANAANMSTPAASSMFQPAVSSGDFSGLVHKVNEYEYRRCGRLAIAVFNLCRDRAGSNGQKINRCQRTYQQQVQVCHRLR